ncbi:histidine phosphatase family protein [Actinoplanes sp. M2I2]|uniref:histidine phosphatase family protein n=1 Tax=Actinoplanes sp. M2I2 TaxID=1734444 RepID=UPI002021F102|nr:histidine phosphatase family protein [Actinoplanes sp. M2I2]
MAVEVPAVHTDVVLVRHAVAVPFTADGPGELTRPLTGDGLRQALELVEPLTALRPVAVWSSPYRRAIQTVEPTARALGLTVHTRVELREWDDGLRYTDDWEPHYARSWADPSYARPPGESLDQLSTRAVGVVRALAGEHAGRVVVAAGHGTFIARALCGFGVPVDWAFSRRMPMPAIYRLRFAGPRDGPAVTGDGL